MAICLFFDLLCLENSLPDFYQNFKDGHFPFQKSNWEFSSIALNQVHEQNNAVLKSVAGVTHILNRQDESALLRWELCSHDIAKYLKDFKDVCSQTNVSICHQSTIEDHYEDTLAFKDPFINNVKQLNNFFSANPFIAHTLSPIDNLSIVYEDKIESNFKNIVDFGQRQFKCYFEERLIKAKTPIDATIKSNSLRLPGKNFTVKKSIVEQSLTAAIICKIKSSYQFWCEEVCNIFKEELFQRAHSSSEDENTLYHGTKSNILKELNSTEKDHVIIFDLSAIVRSNSKSNCLTLDDFANYIYRIILLMSINYERCKIIADRYF